MKPKLLTAGTVKFSENINGTQKCTKISVIKFLKFFISNFVINDNLDNNENSL